jgi:hypothetical protein
MLEWLRDDMKNLKAQVEKVDEKVDSLLKFKYQVAGGVILVSVVFTAAFQVILAYIQKGSI